MVDTIVTRIDTSHAPHGSMTQKTLATSKNAGMRLWYELPPGKILPVQRRQEDLVGYVIRGQAELHLEDLEITLNPGDSWVVPRGAAHTYRILQTFTAVEAGHSPAHCREAE